MKVKFLRNYFVEIWLLIIIVIALTMTVLSLFLYKSFESSTIDTINRLNQDFLRETARTSAYIRRTIRISGMELFSEPSIRRLMDGEDLGNFEVVTGIRRLDSVASIGRFIHSIYVFNARTNYVYATSNHTSERLERFEDRGIAGLLTGEASLRGLIPIARYAETSHRSVPVHTFVFSSADSRTPGLHGALVINVTLDWLREIVQQGESELFIIDPAGTVIYSHDRERFLQNLSGERFVKRVLGDTDRSGAFVELVNGRRSLVLHDGEEELSFIRVFGYDAVMADLRVMQHKTIGLVLGVLAFGVLAAFFISRFLYGPIGRITRSIGYTAGDKALSGHTEIGFLSTAIDTMVARTSSLEATARSRFTVLRREILKELLIGEVLGNVGIAELFAEYGIGLHVEEPFRLLAFRQPRSAGPLADELPDTAAGADRYGCAVCVGDVTVYLLQGNYRQVEKFLVRRLFKHGVRVIATRTESEGAAALPGSFAMAADILKFGFLYRSGQVVDVTDRPPQAGRFEYPTGLEKQILHLARSGDPAAAADVFGSFLRNICSYRYDHFRFSIRRLYVSLQLLAGELRPAVSPSERIPSSPADGSIPGFEDLPGDPETIDEIEVPFERMFEYIAGVGTEARTARHRELSDLVRKEIAACYGDPNLSLQSISDRLGFSGSYISKVFKDVSRTSVADAISEYRLTVAKNLLLDEDTPIREIAARVGFTNENYFFTLFRRKIGMTPAAFRRSSTAAGA